MTLGPELLVPIAKVSDRPSHAVWMLPVVNVSVPGTHAQFLVALRSGSWRSYFAGGPLMQPMLLGRERSVGHA
jgi:hypothetical protein